MTEDEKYMRRCLQLARNGICGASPNPMVGAVIVHNGRIIGEGYHAHYGGPHAEVNAISSVTQPELLCRSTIYVSLEPCSHYGHTPPCADLIISKQIPRVVIGCQDPFSEVAGRGIKRLRDAGREVIVGVLEKECLDLNRKFITFHTKHRPYILLKWAQSADGFIGDGEKPILLSSPLTQMIAHKHRSECAAILVGRRTALTDNPSLTTRFWSGAHPVRLVIDKDLTLPADLRLFDGQVPTWVFTQKEHPQHHSVDYINLDFRTDILPQIMEQLFKRNIQSVLVEGGAAVLQSFIDADLWDEADIELCPQKIVKGIKAPVMKREKEYKNDEFFGRKYRIIYNFI